MDGAESKPSDMLDAIEHRTEFAKVRQPANQVSFWNLFGVSQSAGSRYENGRGVQKPIVQLMLLMADLVALRKKQGAKAVETLEKYGWLNQLLAFATKENVDVARFVSLFHEAVSVTHVGYQLNAIRKFRKEFKIPQAEFWPIFSVTQSGGCRYEKGRTMPHSLYFLMMLSIDVVEMLYDMKNTNE
jgi:predicted transcriptional regulator